MDETEKNMHITQLTLGDFATNCYILQGPTGACAVIDPADGGAEIVRVLESMDARPEMVLLTHGHYDHILAVPFLQERWPGLPVYCHRLDWPKETTEVDMGVVYPTVTSFPNLRHYGEGDEVEVGGLTVKVLHTPGHTPGSVTLQAGEVLFTGDTLFQGDIGRTDFEGGDEGAMMGSLARLAALPGDCRVLPGHDETSTLSAERAHNPYLAQAVRRFPAP